MYLENKIGCWQYIDDTTPLVMGCRLMGDVFTGLESYGFKILVEFKRVESHGCREINHNFRNIKGKNLGIWNLYYHA